MPIRFVCSNCQQRLSVRTEKAGQQVRCPRCRQVILVPAEPPQPVRPEPPGASGPAESPGPSGSAGPPGSAGPAHEEPPLPAESLSDFAVYDRDDDWVYVPEFSEPLPPTSSDSVAVPRRVIYLQGFLLGAVAMVFFIFGLIVGSRSSNSNPRTMLGSPCVVRGQIAYSDEQKIERVDDGSLVVLVPASTRPAEKILVEGMKIDDPPPAPGDRCVAAIRDLGGGLARVDAQGRYRMRVPGTGRYYLLIVSRHARRADDVQPQPQDLAEMGRYFVPAIELLGRQRFEWREVLIEEDRQIDITF